MMVLPEGLNILGTFAFSCRYFGTQSLIPFGFNIAEPHLVARPLKGREKKRKGSKI